jgi:hypothetical protein
VAVIAVALALAACTPGQLTVKPGPSEGAAGHFITPIVFTNTSARPCTLFGYPGVSSRASAHGRQLGPAATRTPAARHTITLKAHGGKANALLNEVDTGVVEASACHEAWAEGFRVYPPGQTRAFYFHLKHRVCTIGPYGDQVRPVAAGSGSPDARRARR